MEKITIRVLFILGFIVFLILLTGGIAIIKGTDIIYNISVNNVDYNSVTIEISDFHNNKLFYSLEKDNQVITNVEIKDKKLLISDLNEASDYEIKIYNSAEIIWTKKISTKKRTVIRFGGDVMATSAFENYINLYGVDYMWEDVSPLLQTADYSIINLETSVSTRGKDTKPVGYGFRSKPETLQGFTNAGIDMVNIANNHILDYGNDAFLDTMKYLNDYNIKYTGGGLNLDAALTPTYVVVDGIKIGFLAANQVSTRDSWLVTDSTLGIVSLDEHHEELLASIKKANQECDVLILMLHWGIEYSNEPTSKQIDLAHQFVDEGVDLIIGTHPHVLQGVEIYNDKPIYYSIGNFIFLKRDAEAGYTALFEVTLDKDQIYSGNIYPINIKGCKANLLEKDNELYGTIMNNISRLSSVMGTTISKDGYFDINNN